MIYLRETYVLTRIHSSGMRTVHYSGHLGGVCLGVSAQGGLPRGVSAQDGVSAWEVSA